MKITNKNLNILIEALTGYKEAGVIDPWILRNGEIIEPLDVLIELRKFREQCALVVKTKNIIK